MPNIIIKKDNNDIKFYTNETLVMTIYNNSKKGILKDAIVKDRKQAKALSMVLSIAGIFIESFNATSDAYKKDIYDVTYIDQLTLSQRDAKYSPRKILRWIESGNIVTVNKTNRIKYEFTRFAYKDGKIIIIYKPVVW